MKKRGVKFSFHAKLEEVVPKVDILYMTRVQKERQDGLAGPSTCVLQTQHLTKTKPNLKVLQPLPRIDEIELDVDETPFAYYFQQAANGLPVRMALLAHLLGKL